MIRPADSNDLTQVMEIERLSFEPPWRLSSFRNALRDIFLVENDVKGYVIAVYRPENNVMATVKKIAVHPEHRRRGIGKALFNTGLNCLRDIGVEAVILNVESSRIPAIHLYKRFGFSITDSSLQNASILISTDPEAVAFYTMELKIDTMVPMLSALLFAMTGWSY